MKKIISSILLAVSVLILVPSFGLCNIFGSQNASVQNKKMDPDKDIELGDIAFDNDPQPRSGISTYKKVEAGIFTQANTLLARVNVEIEYLIRIKDESGSVVASRLIRKNQQEALFSLDNFASGNYTLEYVNTKGSVAYIGYFTL